MLDTQALQQELTSLIEKQIDPYRSLIADLQHANDEKVTLIKMLYNGFRAVNDAYTKLREDMDNALDHIHNIEDTNSEILKPNKKLI